MPYFCNQLGSNYAVFFRSLMTMGYQPCAALNFYTESGLTLCQGWLYRVCKVCRCHLNEIIPISLSFYSCANIEYLSHTLEDFLLILLLAMYFLMLLSHIHTLTAPFLFLRGKLHFFLIQRHLVVNKLSFLSYYYIIYIIYQHPLLSPQSVRKWNI